MLGTIEAGFIENRVRGSSYFAPHERDNAPLAMVITAWNSVISSLRMTAVVLMYCTDCLWKAKGHISEECPLRIQEETIQASTGVIIRSMHGATFERGHFSEADAHMRTLRREMHEIGALPASSRVL